MKPLMKSFTAMGLAIGATLAPTEGHGHAQSSPVRDISPADMINFAVFGDPGSLGFSSVPQQPIIWSNDSRTAAVIVRRGNVVAQRNESTVYIFKFRSVNAQPEWFAAFTMASETNDQPVAMLRWNADSSALYFAGGSGNDAAQVFEYNILKRSLTALTHGSGKLISYEISSSADHLVTFREPPDRSPSSRPECEVGCRIQTTYLNGVMFGWDLGGPKLEVTHISTGRATTAQNPNSIDAAVNYCDGQAIGGISPSAAYLIRRCQLHDYPFEWLKLGGSPVDSQHWRTRNSAYAQKLYLTDLRTGKTRALPVGPYVTDAGKPIWIDNSTVIIPGGYTQSGSAWSVLAFDVSTGQTTRIYELPRNAVRLISAEWLSGQSMLNLKIASSTEADLIQLNLRRTGGGWRSVKGLKPLPAPSLPALRVTQSASIPPRLMFDNGSGVEGMLLDPNPWLADRKLGKVEQLAWKAADGRAWSGGLYYPPDYEAGKPYPLLIQYYGFRPWQFSLTGHLPNFVARAVAAKGVMVLEVAPSKELDAVESTPAVWPAAQKGIEAAIKTLDENRLIDLKNVGILGHSYTGPQVGYIVTHSNFRFASVGFPNAADYGWQYYINSGTPSAVEQAYGSDPFGKGLANWLKLAPSFNLDRVQSPVLMWSAGVPGPWDWYTGLKRMKRPVELWLLPDGQHSVFKVSEKLLTYNLMVDWFAFWLKGHEDPSPDKQEQYARWRVFKGEQDTISRDARPPLLDWSVSEQTEAGEEW